jgi:hypothetical protein
MKTCSKCHQSKDLEKFHINRKSLDGRHTICAECRREYVRGRPLPARDYKKRRYNVDSDTFQTILDNQAGLCAICEQPLTKIDIDHCHTSGRVRGLLCHPCNLGLGMFQDSPELLAKAIVYIERADTGVVVNLSYFKKKKSS